MTNKNPAWNTKYGPRRVRHEAPTLEEAIIAATGMADEIEQQADIAASLMGVERDEVLAELRKRAPRREQTTVSLTTGRNGAPRTIVVERKMTRRVIPGRSALPVRKLGSAR